MEITRIIPDKIQLVKGTPPPPNQQSSIKDCLGSKKRKENTETQKKNTGVMQNLAGLRNPAHKLDFAVIAKSSPFFSIKQQAAKS